VSICAVPSGFFVRLKYAIAIPPMATPPQGSLSHYVSTVPQPMALLDLAFLFGTTGGAMKLPKSRPGWF
jgi:hypothetical protein